MVSSLKQFLLPINLYSSFGDGGGGFFCGRRVNDAQARLLRLRATGNLRREKCGASG
jgi:hypothetical protein